MSNFAASILLILLSGFELVNAKGGGGKFKFRGGGGGFGGGDDHVDGKVVGIVIGSVFGGMLFLGCVWIWLTRPRKTWKSPARTAVDVESATKKAEGPKAATTWRSKLPFFKTPERKLTLPMPATEGQEQASFLYPNGGLSGNANTNSTYAHSFVSEAPTAVENVPAAARG